MMTEAASRPPSEMPAPNALDDAGRKPGLWQEHFASGGVSEEGVYDHGVQQGRWRYWYRNGQLKAIGDRLDLTSVFQIVCNSIERELQVAFCAVALYDGARRQYSLHCLGAESRMLAARHESLGQPDMQAVHTGNLVPGQFFYVDILGFTGSQPGLFEMNISARLLGAAPPNVSAPQFGAHATTVFSLDAPGLFGQAPPGPMRFQIYA